MIKNEEAAASDSGLNGLRKNKLDNEAQRLGQEGRHAEINGCNEYPDEQLLLGLIVRFDLLQQAAILRAEHFRHRLHARIFRQFAARTTSGPKVSIEKIRAEKQNADVQYVARLIDAAARRAKEDDERAEILVRVRAERIVGSIRTIADRAKWYDQLFAACGRKEIGPSEHLLGVAIGRHVKLATGSCYPGLVLLAKETGLGLRSVERGIPTLRDNGHIDVERGRLIVFTPIEKAKIEAAKRAVECTPTTTAKAAPPLPVGGMEDEIPF